MNQALSQMAAADVPWLWLTARTLGICAWVASSAVVIIGLTMSTRLFGSRVSMRSMTTLHRAAATFTLIFVVGHILSLIPDPYAKLTLLDAFVPGLAPNNTFATALGTIAFLSLIVVSLAGIFRSRFSAKAWKAVHSVAYIVWPLVSIHYIVMGTDAMATWSLAMIGFVSGLLVLLLLRRGFVTPQRAVGRASRRAIRPQAGFDERSAELTVTRVIDETADAKTFVFSVPDSHLGAFRYSPGQFLTLRIPSDVTGSVARCYSLSSSPDTDSDWRVTVKRTPAGYASNWLCDNVRVGTKLQALRPGGTFTPRDGMDELLLFAGGSGITPIMSIIKSALAGQRARVTLVYANRDEASIIFRDELRDLARMHPGQLVIHHWLASVSGIPTGSNVTEALASHRDAEIFVCGPAPFMDLVTSTARNFGWPGAKVHVEEFRSLEGDPFAPRSAAPSANRRGGDGVGVLTRTSVAKVELDGQTHEVDWPQDASLVDAMLDAGLDAPYSCLEGVCATCECKLVKGAVESESATHSDGDRVLGCQVRPTSETVSVRF